MGHKWNLVNGFWYVICEENKKDFSAKLELFKEEGLCPYCRKNARNELEIKKRTKKEKDRQKEMDKRTSAKNTLGGWF